MKTEEQFTRRSATLDSWRKLQDAPKPSSDTSECSRKLPEALETVGTPGKLQDAPQQSTPAI